MPPERTFLWRRSFRAGSSEAQLLSTKKKRQRYLHSDRGAGRQLHPLTVGGRGQATEERGRRSRTRRCQSNAHSTPPFAVNGVGSVGSRAPPAPTRVRSANEAQAEAAR